MLAIGLRWLPPMRESSDLVSAAVGDPALDVSDRLRAIGGAHDREAGVLVSGQGSQWHDVAEPATDAGEGVR